MSSAFSTKARLLAVPVVLVLTFSPAALAHKGGKHGNPNSASDAMKNPYAGDESAAAAGKKLYGRNCAGCHGASAQGAGQNPGLLTAAKKDSAGRMFNVITHGNEAKGMPAWSQLPEQQRWQIVTYLQSLK